MKRLFGNPWFLLIFLTAIGAIAGGVASGASSTVTQLVAGALLGFAVGLVNLVDLALRKFILIATAANGLVGVLAGLTLAYIIHGTLDHAIWFVFGGILIGVTARFWIEHINF